LRRSPDNVIREEEVSDHELFVTRGASADGSFPLSRLEGDALTRSFAFRRRHTPDEQRTRR
jgi:hypothetical protein